MNTLIAPVVLAVALTVVAAAALAFTSSSTPERADCPGRIVCPLTGEPICKDRCPLSEQPEQLAPASCCSSDRAAGDPD